jgi:hypothetical protein
VIVQCVPASERAAVRSDVAPTWAQPAISSARTDVDIIARIFASLIAFQ